MLTRPDGEPALAVRPSGQVGKIDFARRDAAGLEGQLDQPPRIAPALLRRQQHGGQAPIRLEALGRFMLIDWLGDAVFDFLNNSHGAARLGVKVAGGAERKEWGK